MFPLYEIFTRLSFSWGCLVLFAQGIGSYRIFKRYKSIPQATISPTLPKNEIPHVTILRPAKGLEPALYECLLSTFQQSYPRDKLTIYFCVASKDDPAYTIMQKLVDEQPEFDARVYVEEEDQLLNGDGPDRLDLGPNPKIRNLSRAYREAKGDIVWVVDCNVWISKNVAGRMVDKLEGFALGGERTTPFKLCHQMPLLVDIASQTIPNSPSQGSQIIPTTCKGEMSENRKRNWSISDQGGGRLEEMFMATTHAKFYSLINMVGVAPCVVGKSNMYRRSHLKLATDPSQNPAISRSGPPLPLGLDHFSAYICEDHLISDVLWKYNIPGYKNHALDWGDLAIQPMADMSIAAYTSRRVRWLRARKWILAATIVEPGIESFVCCFYLAHGLTTIPWFHSHFSIPQTWASLGLCWLVCVMLWSSFDRILFQYLHAGYSTDVDERTPIFARGTSQGGAEKRLIGEWLLAWLGRESLALPIWIWAILLGATVTWRKKKFRVKSDMSVVALDKEGERHGQHAKRKKK